jgi:hypothetical protein
VKSDGTLWAWGENDHGQLGDGTTSERHYPVQIGSDHKWVSVEAGFDHSLAMKSDGTLWAWGWNLYGSVGDGTTSERDSPVQIGSDNKWLSVSGGGFHSLALKSDGAVWAWGWNNYGQIGDGTTSERHSPIQAIVLTAAILISPHGTITTATPAYTWTAVPDSLYYYLWVNDSTGNRIQQWYSATAAGCPAGAGICSVTPATVLNPGAAQWWIQTWNSFGVGEWSAPLSFTVP